MPPDITDDEIEAFLRRVETCLGEERPRDAVPLLQAVLARRPDHPVALCGIGRVSIQLGDNAAALQVLDRAVNGRPDLLEAHNARGVALTNLGRLAEAEAAFRRVLDAVPDNAGALLNHGGVLAAKGDFAAAEHAFGRVLEINPDDPTAAYNLGLARLVQGDFAAGWRGFECRDRAQNVGLSKVRSSAPKWDGTPAPGATLLVHAEQGLGDNIQFVRYLPMVAERVGRVVLEAPPSLADLFRGVAGAGAVITRDDPLPGHDLHIPIMSLPFAFGTTAATVPWPGPYLFAPAARLDPWRGRVTRGPKAFHVGLIWSGNPHHPRDRERSMHLATLEPLLQVPGVRFHSLQIGDAAQQAAGTAFNGRLARLFSRAMPFGDVAAAIKALDLVIGVDTALVHLAGALGVSVWTMVTAVPDWRWQVDRPDTPWYPAMRLFRQARAGEWAGVVAEVADALRDAATQPDDRA